MHSKKLAGTKLVALAAVAILAVTFSAGAADLVLAEASHLQPVQNRAAQMIQNGSFAKVLAGYYSAAEIQKGVYIGQEFCLACHPAYKTFKTTLHSAMVRRPMVDYTLVAGKGVMGDQDKNGKDDFIDGLDFNAISSPFDAYKPNAPKLSVKNGTYIISIAGIDYPVVLTLAGGTPTQDQRFVVRMVVADTPNRLSQSLYFGPISWSASTKKWTANSPGGWYDANNQPRYSANTTVAQISTSLSNYSQNCIGCHSTGIRNMSKSALGEWVFSGYNATLFDAADPTVVDLDGDGNMKLMNITCESCHGPGSAHVLNGPNPANIINPAKLTGAQEVEVCGRCHATAKSLPNQTFGWPYKDDVMADWFPGNTEPLANYFKDVTVYWPDGKLQKSGRPWGDYHTSLHATNGFHTVACNGCHDLHTVTTNEMQLRDSMYDQPTRLTIKTDPENNSFCLACHATHGPFANVTKEMVYEYDKNEEAIGKVVSEHTHHPYAPERTMGLSRCIGCHMAPTGGSHSWRAVAPELTLKYQDKGGMPNSCAAGCHNQLVNIFGMGLKPTGSTWDTTFDKNMATTLQQYYGPGGTWWDTKGTPMAPAH